MSPSKSSAQGSGNPVEEEVERVLEAEGIEGLKNTRPSKPTRVKLIRNTETEGACTGPAQVCTEFKKVLKVVKILVLKYPKFPSTI